MAASQGDKTQSSDLRTWWASLFLLCAILGALFGLSFKTQETVIRRNLPSNSFATLAEQYRVLKDTVANDQRTIGYLQENTSKLETAGSSNTSQFKLLQDDLQHMRLLAGLTDVGGPGIEVVLNDSKKRFPDAPTAIQNLGIIHDNDINQCVNELKAAGAEAVSVNDQRLVSVSAVRCAGNTVLINNTPQAPPFIVRAIGDSSTLQEGLNLPGGFADGLSQMDPAMIKIIKSANLVIPAYDGSFLPRYAHSINATDSSNDQHTQN